MEIKLAKIVQRLNQSGADALVLHAPQNRRYLTGLRASAGTVVVTSRGEAVLVVDFRYSTAARQALGGSPMACEEVPVEEQDRWVGSFLRGSGCRRVLIEDQYLPLARARELEALWPAELAGCGWMEELRAVKTPEELRCIRTSQEIAEKSLLETLERVAPGMTERQVEAYLTWRLLENGSENGVFGIVAASGPNSALPHAVPTDRALERGDLLLIDFGALYRGWYSDITRTVAIGRAGEEERAVYALVQSACEAAIAAVSGGVSAAAADEAARSVIRQAGYAGFFGHGLGHGVGLDIHELPRLRPGSRDTLRPGNVVTVEPGIYLPERFGVRIEDLLAVEEKGCSRLTRMSRELIVL